MVRSLTRTSSFFSQWGAEVLRQPWLLIVLILGPFLVLALFGYGEKVGAPAPRAIIVTPPGSQSNDLAVTPQDLTQFLRIVGNTTDVHAAQQALIDGEADVVVVVPQNPTDTVEQGQHVPIQVLTNEIDPVRLSYAQSYVRQQVDALNRLTVQKTIQQAQNQMGDVNGLLSQANQYLQLLRSAPDLSQSTKDLQQLSSSLDQVSSALHQASSLAGSSPIFLFPGLTSPVAQLQQATKSVDDLRQQLSQIQSQLASVGTPPSPQDLDQIQANLNSVAQTAQQLKAAPPEVLAAPFTADLRNVAPWKPNGAGFYAPAVLVLLIQHLGITLGALSMTRVRLLGLLELFQVAPVRPAEVAVGNYLSYGTLCVVAGGALLGLMLGLMGVPVFGPVAALVGVLLLLIVAAVGIGLVVSIISTSEQQAAQIAMLILIASVFFSGFLVSLDTFQFPVNIVSYLLPATYAIRTLDDVMLRGTFHGGFDMLALAAFAVVFFGLTLLLTRREMRAR
ncbi:MAG: ABC transporter permease [Chloroflexi bacterium]|nr:ABC transporter permease [Chloroflexota bacterium]